MTEGMHTNPKLYVFSLHNKVNRVFTPRILSYVYVLFYDCNLIRRTSHSLLSVATTGVTLNQLLLMLLYKKMKPRLAKLGRMDSNERPKLFSVTTEMKACGIIPVCEYRIVTHP